MSTYRQMIIFILILGSLTSAVILGMDYWTAPFIEANEEFQLKATILEAYGVNIEGDINVLFDQNVDIIEQDGLVFYIDKTTKAISYQFEGNGVWGPIIGIITLNEDFETILNLAILQQEETPGLGGRITETAFLESFKNVLMKVEITKTPTGDSPYEVDAIVGATNTSLRLMQTLNIEYDRYKTAWFNSVVEED